MEFRKIMVLGAGTMGHGIAQLSAEAGLYVNMYDISRENLEKGLNSIKRNLSLIVEQGKMTQKEAEEIVSRVSLANSLEEGVHGVQLVIECIAENLAIKQKVYKDLDALCDPSIILASNTSGISPTSIAEYVEHPERVVVAHFFCPPELIPLVEVVPGEKTSVEVVDNTVKWVNKINKQPVRMKKECLGFIANRMQYALLREAVYIVEQGWAEMEEVDKAVEYSFGRRLPYTGPLKTADVGGLDIFYNISTYLFKDLCRDLEPSPIMREIAEAGNYGTKNGEGFYKWDDQSIQEIEAKRRELLVHLLQEDKKNM